MSWKEVAHKIKAGTVLLTMKGSESRGGSDKPARMWAFNNKLAAIRVLLALVKKGDIDAGYSIHEVTNGEVKRIVKLSAGYSIKTGGTHKEPVYEKGTYKKIGEEDVPDETCNEEFMNEYLSNGAPARWNDPSYKPTEFESLLASAVELEPVVIPRTEWAVSGYREEYHVEGEFSPDRAEFMEAEVAATLEPDCFVVVHITHDNEGPSEVEIFIRPTKQEALKLFKKRMKEEFDDELDAVEVHAFKNGASIGIIKKSSSSGDN